MGYLSNKTKDYRKKQNTWEQNQPGEYQSRWQGTVDDTLNKILNREAFSYDFNADPVYQMYRDQYMDMGKQAMADTVGNVSALTGGYGNSYAATAGSQAYQNYLKQLNSIIPELQQNALAKYQMEGENLFNTYNALGQQEDREYNQNQDNWNRWYNMLGYYADQFNSGADRDLNQWQFKKNLKWDKDKFGQEMAFKREQLAADQAQWAAEFGLKQQQFAQSLTSENGSGSSPSSSSSGRRGGRKRSGSKSSGSAETITPNEKPFYIETTTEGARAEKFMNSSKPVQDLYHSEPENASEEEKKIYLLYDLGQISEEEAAKRLHSLRTRQAKKDYENHNYTR